MKTIVESIRNIPQSWRRLQRHTGEVKEAEPLVFKVEPNPENPLTYSNAQIDDHPNLKRSEFLNQPPLTLKCRARLYCEGEPRGTAGFGFWNDPFLMTDDSKVPTLPKAIWFFWCSSDSDMQLAQDEPGHGWKMGVIDAWSWPFLALVPTVPISVPLMWIKGFRKTLWPVAQKAMKCEEKLCPVEITDWHDYEIQWLEECVIFSIDGQEVFRTSSPKGPLGLVIWIDNQYMKIDPRAVMSHGNIKLEATQSLEIEKLELYHGR